VLLQCSVNNAHERMYLGMVSSSRLDLQPPPLASKCIMPSVIYAGVNKVVHLPNLPDILVPQESTPASRCQPCSSQGFGHRRECVQS